METTLLYSPRCRFISKVLSTSRTGDAFVLKGGTALILVYDLPRFSIDLEFDGRSPSIDLTESIHAGVAAVQLPVRSLCAMPSTRLPCTARCCTTATTSCACSRSRPPTTRPSRSTKMTFTTIDGVRTYRLEKLVSLEIDVLVNRTKARDIFDTNFLLHRHER